jgi:hypothetical protein
MERDGAVNNLGNLTLLTHSLNSSVSNGPYSVKMPAVRSHSSLALNRELNEYDHWDEESIAERGASLFIVAKRLWSAPERPEGFVAATRGIESVTQIRSTMPPEGTSCRFTYAGKEYTGRIDGGMLLVDGIENEFGSFSAASRTITQTNRNGWNDWYLQEGHGGWILANDWRAQQPE